MAETVRAWCRGPCRTSTRTSGTQSCVRGGPFPAKSAFAVQIGFPRAVVRKAFRSLSAVGVIEIGNGRRARVGGIDDTVLPIILNHAVLTEQVSIQ